MKKSKALFLVLLSLIAIGGSGGAVYATSTHINWDDCYGDRCFVHIPSLEQTPYNSPPLLSGGNVDILVILPDGTCNLIGHIQTDGSCNVPDLIISFANYTRLQNDVAYMMVQSKDTTGTPTTNFCPLAENIWLHQTTEYQNKLLEPVNKTKWVVPPSCMQELGSAYKIPEFGLVAALVLAIAIVSIIAVSAKTGLRFIPRY